MPSRTRIKPPRSKARSKSGSKDYWWKSAVFYEVYVDRFAGTFDAFGKRLDYLENLGITCIHLLPHYPSPMIDDGYDVADYKAISPELGTLDDFKTFVALAHARGIRVMIDFVLNHVSTKHPWFVEASSSKDNPKRDYFLWSETGSEFAMSLNPFPEISETNWVYNEQTGDYFFSTFYPQQADLNWDNPKVFAEMTDVIDFWAALGVDAFRLDASSHLAKREGTNSANLPETHAILKRLRAHIDVRHPGIAILAEVHDELEIMKQYFGEGDECHMVYNFPLTEQMLLALLRESRTGVDLLVEASRGIPDNCCWTAFLRHHDEISLATLSETVRAELLDYYDPDKKYRFATGTSMRLATMLRGDTERILRAFELLLSVPGSPIIYYGDEIAMENIPLERGEKDTRRSVRGTFDWATAIIASRNSSSLYSRLAGLIHARDERLHNTANTESEESETLAPHA